VSGWQRAVEERARARLSAALLEYVTQGSRDGVTAAEAGWSDVRFSPHVLRDVTDVDLATMLLGVERSAPWGVAPTTLQRAVHPEGELAMARACADEGVLMVVSSNAGTPFGAIGETGVDWWVQVYLPADRTLAVPMLERATAAGARAVVLTVDTPVVATKYSAGASVWDEVDAGLVRVNFDAGYDEQPGAEKALDLGPHDVGWLAARTGLPVVVKGVLRADDARRCVEAGAAAVWVSNHGGRQLDRAVSARQALPAVVGAVGTQAQVYVDGGIRCGLDVLAAVALGADAVFLGRLPVLALADGQPGVTALMGHLRAEAEEAFRLAGCRTSADTRGIVAGDPPNRS
jgi:4-hydroxymandelate oxidase